MRDGAVVHRCPVCDGEKYINRKRESELPRLAATIYIVYVYGGMDFASDPFTFEIPTVFFFFIIIIILIRLEQKHYFVLNRFSM